MCEQASMNDDREARVKMKKGIFSFHFLDTSVD